jgi:cytochrome c oxidase assembly protein subunit 15
MRHQHAGLAIPDFPLAYGKLWPATDPESVAHYNERRVEITAANPITAFQIELQMAHRMAAALILAAVMGCAWSASRNFTWRSPLTRLAMFWLGLIVAQAGLGAATVWSDKAADIATAHVLVGALSLATGAIWCIISFQSPESARRGPVLSGATANARNGGALEVEAAAAQES